MEQTQLRCEYRPIRLKGASHGLCDACAVRGLAMCSALDPECVDRLTSIATRVHLSPKQILFIEDEVAEYHHTIVKGVVSVSKSMSDGRRQIVGFLFPADFVGVASEEVYCCTAQAVTSVELCRFSRRSFEGLAEAFPELEHRLLHAVSSELIEAQHHMLILGRQTAEERLASFLLHLSDRAPKRGEPDNPVLLPMSRSDIGDYLGLSLETVSRTMTTLRDQGLIELINARTVDLCERDKLRLMAEGG